MSIEFENYVSTYFIDNISLRYFYIAEMDLSFPKTKVQLGTKRKREDVEFSDEIGFYQRNILVLFDKKEDHAGQNNRFSSLLLLVISLEYHKMLLTLTEMNMFDTSVIMSVLAEIKVLLKSADEDLMDKRYDMVLKAFEAILDVLYIYELLITEADRLSRKLAINTW